ncbi:hypothetical protein niasHT_020989 [Heterodera trifolii]|uniref:Plasma membrane proteolipid 3 n=1 Tax=Heterodera trifolii TaxID=157864 RepID=A0ABD2KCN2_9BILA
MALLVIFHLKQSATEVKMVEVQQLIELIFCILLPPVAILLHGGLDILHLILNIVLCILGYVPGIIHALWYCFFS